MESIRGVLEPLKFLPPGEILGCISLVCRRWRSLADCEELWRELCALEKFVGSELTPSWKELFKQGKLCLITAPLVWRHAVALYDCRKECVRKFVDLSDPVEAAEGSSVVFIPGYRLLICGGGTTRQSLSTASIITLATGKVEALCSMKLPRMYHGIALWRHEVYVFGGIHSLVLRKSAEAFDWPTLTWRRISGMHNARASFQPCVYMSQIYLCGGRTKAIEVFDPQSGVFSPLEITLRGEGRACAAVVGEELVVLESYAVTRVAGVHHTPLPMGSAEYDSCGEGPAVVVMNRVYLPIARWSTVVRVSKEGLWKSDKISIVVRK